MRKIKVSPPNEKKIFRNHAPAEKFCAPVEKWKNIFQFYPLNKGITGAGALVQFTSRMKFLKIFAPVEILDFKILFLSHTIFLYFKF